MKALVTDHSFSWFPLLVDDNFVSAHLPTSIGIDAKLATIDIAIERCEHFLLGIHYYSSRTGIGQGEVDPFVLQVISSLAWESFVSAANSEARTIFTLLQQLSRLRNRLIKLLIHISKVPTFLRGIILSEFDFFKCHGTGRPPHLSQVLRLDPAQDFLEGTHPGPVFA